MLVVSSIGNTEQVMEKLSTVDSSCDPALTTGDNVATSSSASVSAAQNVLTETSTRDTTDATDVLPCKLWLCVSDGQALESAIQKSVQSDSSFSDVPVVSGNRKRSRKSKVLARRMNKRRCSRLLDHRSCYVNTDFLDRHKIRYFTFRQYKNDVVYLRPGVYHQVIQLSPNCLEASNFGDAEWQLITGQESVCGRDDQKVVSIEKTRMFECVWYRPPSISTFVMIVILDLLQSQPSNNIKKRFIIYFQSVYDRQRCVLFVGPL
ncbi:hypothetical protein QAD02_015002 [Eretmocerus hayati]|uniref:Uncharacterized protein n=1 Tax=Eretmocerus hayati TaxID=131215 RepID=A0ACC2PBU2_9HYME|nr:hypothetical protein QAD02_015002 [Eretmocerus hayati]